jgi:DnaK suppressor protein
MSDPASKFSESFIARQRQRLVELEAHLRDTAQAQLREEDEVHAQSIGAAQEYEDDAQKLTQLDIDGALAGRSLQRLAGVTRALEKIEAGTYGFSDASGEPIARARLEAMPEAIYTLAEEAAREAKP